MQAKKTLNKKAVEQNQVPAAVKRATVNRVALQPLVSKEKRRGMRREKKGRKKKRGKGGGESIMSDECSIAGSQEERGGGYPTSIQVLEGERCPGEECEDPRDCHSGGGAKEAKSASQSQEYFSSPPPG